MKGKLIQNIKERKLESIAVTIILILVIICGYFAINYLVEKANISDIDLTKEKVYSISDASKDKLENLDEDVTISIHNVYENIEQLVFKYGKLNDHIKINKMEKMGIKPEWKNKYGLTDDTPFIMVESGDREQILDMNSFITFDYSSGKQIDTTEEAVTNGILNVSTKQKPKIYFLEGHNLYGKEAFRFLKDSLKNEVNEVEELNLITTGKVPEDCNALVITTLKEDISEMERDGILNYIRTGGKILLLFDPNIDKINFDNFQKVLDEYGVSISEGFILEGDSKQMIAGAPNFVISSIKSYNIIKNPNMDINICMMYPGKLEFVDDEKLIEKNVTKEVLANVSDKAFYRSDATIASPTKTKNDTEAPQAAIAALMTKKLDNEKESKLIVFTNTAFATNMQFQINPPYPILAITLVNNKDILLNSISYLSERENTITIRKNFEQVTYQVTEQQSQIVLTIIFALPVFIILIGVIVFLVRRRKK